MHRSSWPSASLLLVLGLVPTLARAEIGLWRTCLELRPGHAAAAAAFVDERTGVTVGAWGAVHLTHDGGDTWTAAPKVATGQYAVELLAGGLAWAAGEGSGVNASTDGGGRWSAVGTLSGELRSLSFADARRGIAASADRAGTTGDGGRTWTSLALPAEAGIIATVSASEERGTLVLRILDERGALWTSADGGARWTRAPSPLRSPVLESLRGQHAAMRFRPDREGALVAILEEEGGPRGRAYRTRDGGATWREEAAPGLPPSTLTVAPDARHFTSVDATTLRVWLLH